MFKFVVLCAFAAVAVAEPEPGVVPYASFPLGYSSYSSVVTPAATSYSEQSTSVVHPSPYGYTAPISYAHYLKKRAAPYFPYSYYGAPTTYVADYPVVATHAQTVTPAVSVPINTFPVTHYIKKRSAPLIPTTYVAPTTYVSSHLATPYSTYYPNVAVNYQPNYYPIANTHFIKKRSAPLFHAGYVAPATYIAPTTYAATAPIVSTPYIANPYINNPYLYSTYIKK